MTEQTMTPHIFAELCTWLEERFPGTRNFKAAAAVYGDFIHYHPADVREAARNLFRQGRRNAPTFSEWLAEVQSITRAKHGAGYTARDPSSLCGDGRHTWAIVGELRPDGTISEVAADPNAERIGYCPACKTEKRFTAGRLLTSTEIADREALRERSYTGDRSDRIAP